MSECVAEGRGEVESEVPVWPGPSCLATEYAAQTFNALDAPKKRPSSSKSLNTMRTKIKAIKSRQKDILMGRGGSTCVSVRHMHSIIDRGSLHITCDASLIKNIKILLMTRIIFFT